MHLMGKWWNTENVVNREIIILLNAIFNIGPNLFVLITGYYGVHFKVEKLVHLWSMTLTYTIPMLFMTCFVDSTILDGKLIIHSLFPILTKYKWFITCYIILLFISPYLNKGIESMQKRHLKYLILVGCVFFVVSPTVLFLSIENDAGKGIINMTIVYLIGRYLRLYGIPKNLCRHRMLKLLALVTIIFLGNSALTMFAHNIVGRFAFDSSVFIVLQSILVFSWFIRLDFRNNLINKMAYYCFPLYLFSDFVWVVFSDEIESVSNAYICWSVLPMWVAVAVLATVIYENIRKFLMAKIEPKLVKRFSDLMQKVTL